MKKLNDLKINIIISNFIRKKIKINYTLKLTRQKNTQTFIKFSF